MPKYAIYIEKQDAYLTPVREESSLVEYVFSPIPYFFSSEKEARASLEGASAILTATGLQSQIIDFPD